MYGVNATIQCEVGLCQYCVFSVKYFSVSQVKNCFYSVKQFNIANSSIACLMQLVSIIVHASQSYHFIQDMKHICLFHQ